MRRRKRKIEHICKNCKLFDARQSICSVVILNEGQRINLPVDEEDECFFEESYFDPITRQVDNFNHIEEVKFWVENEKGEKTGGNGTVKFEYPEGFFGDKDLFQIGKD